MNASPGAHAAPGEADGGQREADGARELERERGQRLAQHRPGDVEVDRRDRLLRERERHRAGHDRQREPRVIPIIDRTAVRGIRTAPRGRERAGGRAAPSRRASR